MRNDRHPSHLSGTSIGDNSSATALTPNPCSDSISFREQAVAVRGGRYSAAAAEALAAAASQLIKCLSSAFDHQGTALTLGLFQLEAALAELLLVLGILFQDPIVTLQHATFQVRPIPTNCADGCRHGAAIHTGTEAGLLGQCGVRCDLLGSFQFPKKLGHFRRSARDHVDPLATGKLGYPCPINE